MALHSQVDDSATIVVRGLTITITPELINIIITLPLGIKWNSEDKVTSAFSKKIFCLTNESHRR